MCETNCPVWIVESSGQLQSVVDGLLEFYRFLIRACQTRYIPNHGDLKTYHGKVFRRVVPVVYYAGNYRSRHVTRKCLAQNVAVAGAPGSHYQLVPIEMDGFSDQLKADISATDLYMNRNPSVIERAQATAQLAASAMGAFVKIHPFINGNGRMARMLANFIFKRYGFPMPFVASHIRPPEAEYGSASAACMQGDYVPMYRYLIGLAAR